MVILGRKGVKALLLLIACIFPLYVLADFTESNESFIGVGAETAPTPTSPVDTPTPTNTPTATATATSTNTSAPTNTPTVTPTPSNTPVLFSCSKVTNLNNTGAGSFRDEVENCSNEVIVYETSGNIVNTSTVRIDGNYCWVAGQTAPSPGISLNNSTIQVTGSNNTFEHHYVYTGDAASGTDYETRDGLVIERLTTDIENTTIRHNSFMFAIDELVGTYDGAGSITGTIIEDNILAFGLYFSLHPDVRHSAAAILWADDTSMRRNLIANNQNRNFFWKANSGGEIINNVFFNAGGTSGVNWNNFEYNVSASPFAFDVISNLWLQGANSPVGAYAVYSSPQPVAGSLFYLNDNRGPTRTSNGDAQFAIANISPTPYSSASRVVNITPDVDIYPVATAIPYVLTNAGARPWDRSAADQLVVSMVATAAALTPAGTPTYGDYGGYYVDCVEACGTPNPAATATPPHTQTPFPGGLPVFAANTHAVDCTTGWPKTAAEVETWLLQFEVTPTPTNTATATPTSAAPTNTPTPTPTATPVGFAGVGTTLTANNNASSSTWAPTTSATVETGNIAVCVIAIDNISTGDGVTNDVTGVTDAAGNTWSKGREYTNGEGGAGAGATVAVFYTRATSQLNSAAAITFTFSGNTTAKAAKCYEFTGGNVPLSVDGTADTVNDASDPGSLTATGSFNIEHLWIRAMGLETSGTTWTQTAGWTKVNATASAGGIAAAWEFKIATGTSSGASDPTYTAVDSASTLIGLIQ